MDKIKHIFDEKLEHFLMYLNEDQLMDWFKTNTIDWDNSPKGEGGYK